MDGSVFVRLRSQLEIIALLSICPVVDVGTDMDEVHVLNVGSRKATHGEKTLSIRNALFRRSQTEMQLVSLIITDRLTVALE